MIELISQGIKTIKQYGLKVFFFRLYNYSIFKAKRFTYPKDVRNLEKYRTLKGKYAGKRIFIVGNGPSLNRLPLYLLKNEYTMCFNRFVLMEERINWFPHFYTVTDDLVLKDQAEELNEYIIPKVDYAFFPDIHPSNLSVKKLIKQKDNVLWLYVDKPNFSDNLPQCGINKTVVNAGIQIAAYLGFEEIYLIGVDMTFGDQQIKKMSSRNWQATGDDPNHFDPRYFGSGRSYHNPGVDEMLQRFAICREFFTERGVRIYNAGDGGKLEIFPRVKFDEILNISLEQQQKTFWNAIKSIDETIQWTDFMEYDENNTDCSFKIDVEKGIPLIRKLIISHIPFGPYRGTYFFLKRK
ncbi:6-hydroxymethylpterin diphosphokinase MptE-like protein [Bacteroides cellulosilyticus]|uniref:6-hydroxymethylpterin diphosphokinase MptE-like protein n=1 Tax=Bacteroides cellulosilyticus TaxID=246787 RepID=UPI0032C0AFD2